MKKTFILLTIIPIMVLSFTSCNDSNSPAEQTKQKILWEHMRSYQGYGDGQSIEQISGGGYIIAGNTFGQAWLIRIDSAGKELWNEKYGGKFGGFADANYVQPTFDGGFILIGSTKVGTSLDDAFELGDQVWLVKLDAKGKKVWEATWGERFNDNGKYVQQTSDGGYLILATKTVKDVGSVIWLIRTDAFGNELWNKTIGPLEAEGRCIQQTTDGGYIIVGKVWLEGKGDDVLLLKIDKEGNELWEKTFTGIGSDVGYFIQQTTDRGYILVGDMANYTSEYPQHSDIWVIKVDDNGNEQWNKIIGNTGFETGRSIRQTHDGGYILTGGMALNEEKDSDTSIVIIKLDPSGNTLWHQYLNARQSNQDEGQSIIQDSDGSYVLTGTVGKKMSILDRISSIYRFFDIDNTHTNSLFFMKVRVKD